MKEYLFDEFANEVEKKWWEKRRRELEKLSGLLEIDLLEHIPEDIRKTFFHINDIPNDIDSGFLLKHWFSEGNFKVCVDSKIIRYMEKINRSHKDDLMEIIKQISIDKTGKTLPNSHNDKVLKRINKTKRTETRLKRLYTSNVKGKSLVIQYRPSDKVRVIWEYSTSDDNVYILDVNNRGKLGKLLWD